MATNSAQNSQRIRAGDLINEFAVSKYTIYYPFTILPYYSTMCFYLILKHPVCGEKKLKSTSSFCVLTEYMN